MTRISKKKEPTAAGATAQAELELYPWAKLYNMESGVPGTAGAPTNQRGRPFRPFVRRPKTAYFSDEEISIINKDLFHLREALSPSSVTQYQLIGLALRLLDDRMRFLPERVTTWDEIVKAVFEGRE
jgi:hypothetical protein